MLGNLACAVSGDLLRNSDPEILEYLKNCKDISDSQILAMQELLMKGTSKYGQVIFVLKNSESTYYPETGISVLILCNCLKKCSGYDRLLMEEYDCAV